MRLVWVALMAGCGFSGNAAPTPEADAATPIVDGRELLDVPAGATCWELMGASAIHLKACTTATVEDREVTAPADVDTDATASGTALGCAPLVDGSEPLCAIVARKLTVRAGVRITAHGGRPLAVFATEIDLQGAIDVSSRETVRGAGGTITDCNTNADKATDNGGGAGGGFGTAGANGGDEGGEDNSGATGGGTIGASFRGGCDGTGGSKQGVVAQGGAGGGAVWLSVTGKLTLGKTSLINASGAGGPGGLAPRGGGGGGGSGGLIIIQAASLTRDPDTQVFANGGHGGGGASADDPGARGGEPERPSSGGDGASGKGAHDTGQPPKTGPGGDGAKGSNTVPQPGNSSDNGAGAGGGGGGFGEIWTNRRSDLGTGNVSPNPQDVP